VCGCGRKPRARQLTRGITRPSAEEIQRNRRARSAKLRAIEMLGEGGRAAAGGRGSNQGEGGREAAGGRGSNQGEGGRKAAGGRGSNQGEGGRKAAGGRGSNQEDV
jgi:hypothetical protein